MPVPATLLDGLAQLPTDRPVTLLVRHSARYPILDEVTCDFVGLNAEGLRMALSFGEELGKRRSPGRFLSSPVGRCLDTAAAIRAGAGWKEPVREHAWLGYPHLMSAWNLLDSRAVSNIPPRPISELLDLTLEQLQHANGQPSNAINVLVTHDTSIACMARILLDLPVRGEGNWPAFLEGMYVWKQDGATVLMYRGRAYRLEGSRRLALTGARVPAY